jgi:hypothetical protein
MFWKKPPNQPKSGKTASPSRDELIAQAKAGLRAARAELGEENIAKMKAMVLAQQDREAKQPVPSSGGAPSPARGATDDPSPAQRARELIKTMDKAKVADYIRTMSREDD